MADYISLGILVFVLNIIPALMPPTWVVLALAQINDTSFNPFMLAFVGAVCSTCGRAVLTFYSGFFRRFFNKDLAAHADEIKGFFDQRKKAVFMGSFLFALSPIPSNLLFVASGLTKIKTRLLLAGFFFGRFFSYLALVILSHGLFSAVEQYTGPGSVDTLKILFDVLGIAAAFLLIFVDWKQVGKHAKAFARDRVQKPPEKSKKGRTGKRKKALQAQAPA
ncbi:MAG: hypothetical protein NT067_07040 [Candidatus Diapherotrites archaeon]|nr:hypothetical protein [Candidatus Diapherotrites archaeon]